MTEFAWPVRIYYEDTDAGGVVYYANYLKFFERARTEFLRQLGFEQDDLIEREGVLFAVRSIQTDYLRPARFNDLLSVTCRVTELKRASVDFFQQAYCNENLLCRARVRIACLDAVRFRPRPIPSTLWQVLQTHE
ncbi:MAG TPA: tol-pal system-associated acyl-CoA thioesterase [Methylothermaceae bacterium]|nr:tol-pal system-associated acyl-CoA thioesterase [Methylothermaceae bacterium]